MSAAERVESHFRETTGRAPQTIWSAPGRVNLIGEHTDYNGGFALPFAVGLRVHVAAARRADDRVTARSRQLPAETGVARLGDLAPSARGGGWLDYAFGVVWSLGLLGEMPGLDLVVDGDVPLGSGLSSSAALECAIACAVAELAGLDLSPLELAHACQRAENEYAGVPSGLMDQLASLLCIRDHALFLDLRTLAMRQAPLDPARAGCALLLVETGVRHTLASSAYAERRRSCEAAARRLNVPTLRDVAAAQLDAALAALGDPLLVRRVRHVVSENARVLEARRLLEHGRLVEVGPLLSAAHASLRDDFEVSCPELDVAAEAAEAAGAFGARMVGGGFGGAVLALAPSDAEQDVRVAVASAFAARGFGRPDVLRVAPAGGAQRRRA